MTSRNPARDSHSGAHTLVARNTAWNLLGAVLPIPVALVCIPVLVGALGVERFGVLGVAWMVLGYFGMFDFGLAQSTTKFISTGLVSGTRRNLRALALGSVMLHAALGMTGAAVFALLVPWLTAGVFQLPASLVEETRTALYWLAASVPAIVVTAALRGALEGLQRFDVVNIIRIPASIANYAGPLIALYFGTDLPLVVAVIVVARFAVLSAYALACLKFLPSDPAARHLESAQLMRLAAYGGWLTVSNLANPVIIAADRFVIAATVSLGAVAYYVTPYEVITKAWILSASLLGALFPVLSALAVSEPGSIRAACRSAQRSLLAVAAPIIALVLGCADLLLQWWLGADFRDHSTAVARLLAVGILVNIVAQVPLTALNAVGRADVTARIAALELPFYVAAIWYAAAHYGINGVAAVWAARAGADALALFLCAHAVLPMEARSDRKAWIGARTAALVGAFLAGAWLAAYAFQDDVGTRLSVLAVLIVALVGWEWRVLLTRDDRNNIGHLCKRLLAGRVQ